jgi:NADPH:quinone reductase-like Zn-dependent oxidoreductase
MAGAREFDAVLSELSAGRLHPVLDSVLPFDRAGEAFRRFEAADLFGKIVLDVPPSF